MMAKKLNLQSLIVNLKYHGIMTLQFIVFTKKKNSFIPYDSNIFHQNGLTFLIALST